MIVDHGQYIWSCLSAWCVGVLLSRPNKAKSVCDCQYTPKVTVHHALLGKSPSAATLPAKPRTSQYRAPFMLVRFFLHKYGTMWLTEKDPMASCMCLLLSGVAKASSQNKDANVLAANWWGFQQINIRRVPSTFGARHFVARCMFISPDIHEFPRSSRGSDRMHSDSLRLSITTLQIGYAPLGVWHAEWHRDLMPVGRRPSLCYPWEVCVLPVSSVLPGLCSFDVTHYSPITAWKEKIDILSANGIAFTLATVAT